MLIIGLSGKKGSGKDEACQVILNALGGERFAFADALKRELAEACGVSVDDINANKSMFRMGLQWWGTQFRREYCQSKNYWIDQCAHAIHESTGRGEKIAVITDVRFRNEYDYVRSQKGVMIRIESNRCELGDTHASETELDCASFDLTIQNNGTLNAFRGDVRRIAEKVIKQRL